MPPVSHLYFLGFFFFGCVTVFQETEGEFTVLVSDFCSGILTEQETGLAKCEHKLPVNTLIK